MSTTLSETRITILKAELDALKQQRKEQAKAKQIANRWVSVKHDLPDAKTRRVIAWADGQMERCWFREGVFYVYDGTWFVTEKERLDGVTHWMARDWMEAREWPLYGPGVKNRLLYYWRRLTNKASAMADDLRPRGWSTKAQMDHKVTFYRDRSGRIMTGMPEQMATPRGLEKIVCGSALEAERYSSIQRQQDKVYHSRLMEERMGIEEAKHKEIRSEMYQKMSNARNATNREFMRRALEKANDRKNPIAYERESYLHSEGYERGR